MLAEKPALLHALAERLLEKEVLDGAEVIAMVKAFDEGRPLTPEPQMAVASNPPPSGTAAPKEKPQKADEEENASVPGLQPKPSLA